MWCACVSRCLELTLFKIYNKISPKIFWEFWYVFPRNNITVLKRSPQQEYKMNSDMRSVPGPRRWSRHYLWNRQCAISSLLHDNVLHLCIVWMGLQQNDVRVESHLYVKSAINCMDGCWSCRLYAQMTWQMSIHCWRLACHSCCECWYPYKRSLRRIIYAFFAVFTDRQSAWQARSETNSRQTDGRLQSADSAWFSERRNVGFKYT